jgi:hypothetical protein
MTAALFTEELFHRTQCIKLSRHLCREVFLGEGGGWAGNRLSQRHISTVLAGFQLPARPPYYRTGFTKPIQLFFALGKMDQAFFYLRQYKCMHIMMKRKKHTENLNFSLKTLLIIVNFGL